MKRVVLLLTALFMLTPKTAAASETEVDPGLIGPAHPLYEVDVLLDDVTRGMLKSPGDVAHERASEAFVAAEANNTAARDRALAEVEKEANWTNGVEHADGLQKAEQVLLDLRDRVPEQAVFGIDTALESVTQAQNQFPTDPLPGETGPNTGPETAPAQQP